MTRYDGMAFPAADIRETQHPSRVAQDVPDYAPETITCACMVNPASACECSPNVPTLNCPEDLSVAMFLFNMAGGAE